MTLVDRRIPFNDLARLDGEVRAQSVKALDDVIASGWFVMGPQHEALERELSEYLGSRETVLVGNGTDALQLALAACGVETGDTVATVANAGGYTSVATRALGARPVFVDVDPVSLLMTPDTFDTALRAFETRPRAVVVTHLFGSLAPIEAIARIARAHGIAVIEDCAQSLGATVAERRGGTFGDISTTSFYPTKNLGAFGDGGALFTDDHDLAAAVRSMRQYGWSSKYTISRRGGQNSRMDEMQAAVVRVKLRHLDGWNAARRAIHERYEAAARRGLRVVNTANSAYSGHLAVVEVDDRVRFRAKLESGGIASDVHYPLPDHLQPFTGDVQRYSLPVTEHAAAHIVSIPLFPELTEEEVVRIAAALSD